MKKILRNLLFILFPLLCLILPILPGGVFPDGETRHSLILTGLINLPFLGGFLLFRNNKGNGDAGDKGMILFILYNVIPLFLLVPVPLLRIIFALILILAAAYLLLSRIPFGRSTEKSRRPWLFAGILILFVLLFTGRANSVIPSYLKDHTDPAGASVAAADLVLSLIWLVTGIKSLFFKGGRFLLLFPAFFQASLLFLSLCLYLILLPLAGWGPPDYPGLAVIFLMGFFFYPPAVILYRKRDLL